MTLGGVESFCAATYFATVTPSFIQLSLYFVQNSLHLSEHTSKRVLVCSPGNALTSGNIWDFSQFRQIALQLR